MSGGWWDVFSAMKRSPGRTASKVSPYRKGRRSFSFPTHQKTSRRPTSMGLKGFLVVRILEPE